MERPALTANQNHPRSAAPVKTHPTREAHDKGAAEASSGAVASDAAELAVFFPVAPALRSPSVPAGLVTCAHLSPPSPSKSSPPFAVYAGEATPRSLEHNVPVLRVYRSLVAFFFFIGQEVKRDPLVSSSRPKQLHRARAQPTTCKAVVFLSNLFTIPSLSLAALQQPLRSVSDVIMNPVSLWFVTEAGVVIGSR